VDIVQPDAAREPVEEDRRPEKRAPPRGDRREVAAEPVAERAACSFQRQSPGEGMAVGEARGLILRCQRAADQRRALLERGACTIVPMACSIISRA